MHEAVVAQVVAAPRDRVWTALTEPAELAAWFWPWQPAIEFRAVAGAAYAFEAEHPQAGRLAVDGRVMAAEPPERLALTWRWTDEPGPTTEVDIRLGDLGDETEVVVRHRRVELEQTAADYEQAWTDLLDRLARHVASG